MVADSPRFSGSRPRLNRGYARSRRAEKRFASAFNDRVPGISPRYCRSVAGARIYSSRANAGLGGNSRIVATIAPGLWAIAARVVGHRQDRQEPAAEREMVSAVLGGDRQEAEKPLAVVKQGDQRDRDHARMDGLGCNVASIGGTEWS
jgi:hypothetical protein